jgi:hypothetical protein
MFSQAQSAGFDGFEFAGVDPKSDSWKDAMDLAPNTNLNCGFSLDHQGGY